MTDSENTSLDNDVFTIPNQITAARFVLSIVVFILIPLEQYAAAMVVFILAAATDWVDGWWARKYNQVSKIGRMFDPFVDKIIICGAFILLAATEDNGINWIGPDSGIMGWMAVVVVGRELLVTAIRGFIEQQGGDFSANFAGKLKMVFQCVAVCASLVTLSWTHNPTDVPPMWLYIVLHGSVWLAVASTVYSGAGYVMAGVKIIGGTPKNADEA